MGAWPPRMQRHYRHVIAARIPRRFQGRWNLPPVDPRSGSGGTPLISTASGCPVVPVVEPLRRDFPHTSSCAPRTSVELRHRRLHGPCEPCADLRHRCSDRRRCRPHIRSCRPNLADRREAGDDLASAACCDRVLSHPNGDVLDGNHTTKHRQTLVAQPSKDLLGLLNRCVR